jgi:predicted  nucleic acid-binding Zn-ribbon protein
MPSYAETLNTLRQARAERDQAKAALYETRLEQLKLLRAQRKADRQETADDAATADLVAQLRDKIDNETARLREIEQALSELEKLKGEIQIANDSLAALTEQLKKLQQTLTTVRSEPERAPLLAEIEVLQRQIEDLKARLAELKRRLRELKSGQADLAAKKEELQAEIKRLEEELNQAASSAPAHQDQSDELARIRTQLPEDKKGLEGKEKAVRALIDQLFFERSPQQLIEEWSDATPIMLLPLRIETRFKEVDGRNELWVRVFPDEIAVTTHEKILTEREQTHGIAYWKTLRAAARDAVRKKAWQALADKFGANRAAWVALQTKPLNWSTPPPPSDDLLQFPKLPLTKPDSWTQAPHSVIMPDRFVLMGYRGGALVQTAVGEQISDALVVGPAPLEDDGNPSIKRDPADQRLQLGEDFRWIADFPLARARGMGFRLLLEAANLEGFDQLLVLGLKLSADDKDGQKLVEDLIDNHHYSAKGFSLLPQGTPTNNTDSDSSGFGKDDWLHDVSYFVETGDPLFQFEPDPRKASDGQRLAEYLGINYAPLQYIYHSNGSDHAEAVAMNKALYPGTLGYYLNSMLNEVMSDETIVKARQLFTEHVTGRGPLSAIRVGSQPYGILLTSAFPQWSYPRLRFVLDDFEEGVRRVLASVQQRWQTLKGQLAHIGKDGNASENLMKVLGLQPTSADYYQRVGYSLDYLTNLEEYQSGGRYFGDVIRREMEHSIGWQLLKDLGYQTLRDDGTRKPTPLLFQLIWRLYHSRLDPQNLVDKQPLSEGPPYPDNRNYIRWLLDNADKIDNLEAQDFGALEKPNALLYLMLHNALLIEARNSIHRLLSSHGIVADELVRSRKFMNITEQPDVSQWEVFRAPVNRVIATETSDRPLLAFVQLDRFTRGTESDVGADFAEVKDALVTLSKVSTARLERAFAEHIDTLNYRLDSWQMALFDRRLREHRGLSAGSRERQTGIYLGSYGYLENVRPMRERRLAVPEDVLPPEMREQKPNLYLQPRNGGYVHTPSLNHATAAAILRNGYLTHSSPQERDKLAVNLSSERVRRAKYLIDGVRNGQSLEALLGYLFERGLHDWSTRPVNPVILNQLKPFFRTAFPIRKTKIPRQGFAAQPAEVIEDFQVVNGLDLAQTTAPFPYGVTDLPPLDAQQIDAIKTVKIDIENSLDALRDVLTAESAYQLALGNFDRAGAVMQSLSSGEIPVEVEVIRSSRGTDLSFTNRLALQFDPALTANPWPAISLTLRARTEPGFNHWVGDLLGDPATIRCMVRAVDANGAVLHDASNAPMENPVSLADLGLQPLDFIYLITKKVEATGYSELETRIRYHFARQHSLSDATIVRIEFANSGNGNLAVRSFAEILPLADAIRELTGKARPLQASDFLSASKTTGIAGDNPGNIDVGELQSRVSGLRNEFDLLMSALSTAADDADTLKTESALDNLRQRLIDIANAGLVHAFPLSAIGFDKEQRESLVAQARSLLTRYNDVKKSYDTNMSILNAASSKPPQKITLLTEMAKSFLGDDFKLLFKFTLWNTADVLKADAHRDQLLAYLRNTKNVPFPVDEWMHGVALVRPSVHTFNTVLMLAQTFGTEPGPCNPMQLPYRDKDTWLGLDFPEGTTIVHDTISMVQCIPQGFSPGGMQTGLLIDDWTESLPRKEEVTGIAFNYDQPNSAPPAAILLAVTPEETGKWQWDNLAASVLDTFERAKLRAVEPDMIETLGGFATLVPSTIAEFSTGRSTISLDYSLNINLINEEVAALVTTTRNA